jgi:hypothetical protein
MCLQYGVAIPQSYTRDKIISGHTSGFTIRLDAKKYIQSKKPRKAAFDHILGIETFYTQYSHSDDMRYTDTLNRDNVYMDTVLYNRKMFGIALIAGVQHRVTKHILVQLYTGLGIKVRNITTEGSFTPPAGYKPGRGNMLGANPYEPGAHAALAMPFHFSIGYYFK